MSSSNSIDTNKERVIVMSENIKALTVKFKDVIFLFLVGSVIGWQYEAILYVLKTGAFVNRGMLHGSWLPIYGFGCVLMVFLKNKFGNNPGLYFLICTAASAVLEYFTSWLMERVYNERWWDYSDYPLNLNGRIFVFGLIGFGAAGCVFAYFVIPKLQKAFQKLPKRVGNAVIIAAAALLAIDAAVSMFSPNSGFGITN